MRRYACNAHLFSLLALLVLALTALPSCAIGSVTAGDPIPIVASFSAVPSEGSAPLLVHFTDTSTGDPTSWRWDLGDGSSSTERNPAHTFTQDGMYVVTLFAERAEPHGADECTAVINVLIGDEVVADFTGTPIAGDAPLAVQFTDRSIKATSWAWSFGDGGTSQDRNPRHVYDTPGNYTVSLRAMSDYRTDTETRAGYVSVTGPVAASFTASARPVPVGSSIRFTDTSTGNPYTYAWEFGDGATSTERNPTHAYQRSGTYTVSLTAANSLHTDTRTETGAITVYDEIHASFTANQSRGYAPLAVRFTDTSSGSPTEWAWAFGDGGSSTEQDPVHVFENAGAYSVTLMARNGYSSYTTTALDCIVAVLASSPPVAVPGGAGIPADTDGDRLYDDVNGNGRADFADVVLYFEQMGWIAANEPLSAFDCTGNGRIDFADVVWLFTHLGGPAVTPTVTPTATPTTMTDISGHAYEVNGTGAVRGPIAGATIRLDLADPGSIDGFAFPMHATTDADGAYSFAVPDVPATYRLTETGLDPGRWRVYSPAGGVIDGVAPGGTGYDFMNQKLFPDGIVMYLNKTVAQGCAGGYVVDGTCLQGEASAGDHVSINYQRYQFSNNEQFRFTIVGNQTSGQLNVEHFDLTRLTFNVKFEVREFGTTEWMVPNGFSADESDPWNPINIGVPSSVSISAIDKNLANDDSTLTYIFPSCQPSDTVLLLDGEARIDEPADDTYLEFAGLHAVHDVRYGAGLTTMWMYLEPAYNYLLVQGECLSP